MAESGDPESSLSFPAVCSGCWRPFPCISLLLHAVKLCFPSPTVSVLCRLSMISSHYALLSIAAKHSVCWYNSRQHSLITLCEIKFYQLCFLFFFKCFNPEKVSKTAQGKKRRLVKVRKMVQIAFQNSCLYSFAFTHCLVSKTTRVLLRTKV